MWKEKKMDPPRNFTDPHIHTDPFGSYTGQPENRYETPVQDADDL